MVGKARGTDALAAVTGVLFCAGTSAAGAVIFCVSGKFAVDIGTEDKAESCLHATSVPKRKVINSVPEIKVNDLFIFATLLQRNLELPRASGDSQDKLFGTRRNGVKVIVVGSPTQFDTVLRSNRVGRPGVMDGAVNHILSEIRPHPRSDVLIGG